LGKAQVVAAALSRNSVLLWALLKQGTLLLNQLAPQARLAQFTTAWAHACSLCCSATPSLEHLPEDSAALERLVLQCQVTAGFFEQAPLRVQPDNPTVKRLRVPTCADAHPGQPFSDTSTSTIALHCNMISRELLIALRERNLAPVPQAVWERLLSTGPRSSGRPVQLDEAIARLKVAVLRERLSSYVNVFRCAPGHLVILLMASVTV
jgi:hypothetical protein